MQDGSSEMREKNRKDKEEKEMQLDKSFLIC